MHCYNNVIDVAGRRYDANIEQDISNQYEIGIYFMKIPIITHSQ